MEGVRQVGGDHYEKLPIQPIEYIQANNLDFIDGNCVKYASRHKYKNKDEDVKKLLDYAILCLKHTYGYTDAQIAAYLMGKYIS